MRTPLFAEGCVDAVCSVHGCRQHVCKQMVSRRCAALRVHASMLCRAFLDKAKEVHGYDPSKTMITPVAPGATEFEVVWSPGPRPDHADASDTCTVQLPLHLRREDPDGTLSIGHLLRDNLYHLISIPKQLGLLADTFAWVTWPRQHGLRATKALHIITKTSPLLSAHTSRRWHELEAGCRSNENVLGPGAPLVCGPHCVPSRTTWHRTIARTMSYNARGGATACKWVFAVQTRRSAVLATYASRQR